MDKQDFFIAHVEPGKLNALVKNISRQIGTNDPREAVRLVNSGEYKVVPNPDVKVNRCWYKKEGIFYFSATFDGEEKNFAIISSDKLEGRTPNPYNGSPNSFFCDEDDIFFFAEQKGFEKPNSHDASNYLKNALTGMDFAGMGFEHIIIMSEPARSSNGYHWWLLFDESLREDRVATNPSFELMFLKGEPDGLLFIVPEKK